MLKIIAGVLNLSLIKAGKAYNIGGDNECANIDIVHTICTAIDELFVTRPELGKLFPEAPAAKGGRTDTLITFVKDRLGHDWRYAIDATRSSDALGYSPQEDFSSGLARTIDWMIEHQTWWRAVMDGSYRDWIETNYD